jgi:serine/threonine protein kinase
LDLFLSHKIAGVCHTCTEIKIGQVIGTGGFSVVSEVQGIKLDEVNDTSDEDAAVRGRFAATCREGDPNNLYVIKVLRTDLSEDEHTKGIVDLAIEANFLETLSHPNIITMRAMANSDPYESRFFIILDRLVVTLERKMNLWRKEVGANVGVWMGPCFGYCCAKKHALYRLWMERIMVCRDISKAIYYLHSQDIVYRDLVSYSFRTRVSVFSMELIFRCCIETG